MYSIRKERERVGLVVVVGSIVNLLADVLMVCSHDPWLIYHRESSPPPPSPILRFTGGGGRVPKLWVTPFKGSRTSYDYQIVHKFRLSLALGLLMLLTVNI